MTEFYNHLMPNAHLGRCLLKGVPNKELHCESRAGSTDANSITDFVCLDIDGLPNCSVTKLMCLLGLDHVDHIVQYSASYLIENTDLKCHIFFQCEPITAPALKQWLIQINHATPALCDCLALTKTGHSLHWPLDITACQNDKLIYVAPPVLNGIDSPIKERITFVQGTVRVYKFPPINEAIKNKVLTEKRIAELREKAGLPARKHTTKLIGQTEVVNKPDAATLSNIKTDNGFVRFNLNGGDSWAYYHHESNPEFIHNFKGEPSYLTKELLPEYWASLHRSPNTMRSDGTSYLAFSDRKTGTYWCGTFDHKTDSLEIYPTRTKDLLLDFTKQHGVPIGDYVPRWDLHFDPMDTIRLDSENRTINTFEPTIYMQTVAKFVKACPPLIHRVILNVTGGDLTIADRFINWVAYILQERTRTGTSWLAHGTTGTGKGVLYHKILAKLFGRKQCAFRTMENLTEQYNDYMESALIVFIDEMDAKSLKHEQAVMAKLRSFITEEHIPVRAMYSTAKEVNNYTNWIFSSNKTTPLSIDREDRRTNVGKYQPNKLDMTSDEIDNIEGELQDFHDYLLHYKVNLEHVRNPIQTEDRDQLIIVSEQSIDTVATALLNGDMQFFIDQLPTSDKYKTNVLQLNKVEEYKDVLTTIMTRTTPNGKCNIARDEMKTLFNYTVDDMPQTSNKFTARIKHHRIYTKGVKIDGRTVMGIDVTWKNAAVFPA